MDINAADTGRSVCGIPVRGGGNATALPSRIVIVVVVVCAAVLVAAGVPAEPVTALLTAWGVLAAHGPLAQEAVAAPVTRRVRRAARRRP
ncbi:hypothetical protein ACFYUL_21825 [Streptomyces sp. NPDC004311]|uniref:hypothetical protein n=1 Tax=Streptomyces sp. NPDC004311 TaxID=3364698 RepID=UPI0036C1BE54